MLDAIDRPGEVRFGTKRGTTWRKVITIYRDLTGYTFSGKFSGNGIEPIDLDVDVTNINTSTQRTYLSVGMEDDVLSALPAGVYRYYLSWDDGAGTVFTFLAGPFNLEDV